MQNSIEVLVLCGGEGTRLRSVVSDVPKPMAPIGEKPFLDYLVKNVSKQGFTNFCFLAGYKAEKITSYFQDNFTDLNVRFSIENKPLGTGGSIFLAMKTSPYKQFLILNGDTFFNIDLKDFIKNWEAGTLKIALKKTDDTSRYGLVKIAHDGRIKSFQEKGAAVEKSVDSLINGGIYLLDASLLPLDAGDEDFISLENEIFPQLLQEEKIRGQVFTNDFIDIGIPEDYSRASILINKWVNETPGY